MKIYAKVGSSEHFTDERENPAMPEGFNVEMKESRPESPDPDNYTYVADENGQWVLVKDRSPQIAKATLLLDDAHRQVEMLQDRVDFDDYVSDDELASIQADLKKWKKYRIELNKFIKGEREDMPQPII